MATMNEVFAGYEARKKVLSESTHPFAQGVAWIEGQLVPFHDARIPLRDQGFLHSDLTYDVPAIWDGRFFRLDDHLARLEASCKKIRMTLPKPKEEIKSILTKMAAESGIRDAFVELIVTRGLKGVRESQPHEIVNTLYMFIVPYIWVMEPEMQLGGGDAIVARTVRRVPPGAIDPTVKNLQWGDLTRAMWEARDRGAKYPFLTDGDSNLTEGSGFNVCFIKDGILYTPDRGVLHGVTRKSVFDAARKIGVEIRCEIVPVEMAYQCDEILMCTTAGGIMPITTLDGVKVKDGRLGPITKQIWDEYWAMHWYPEYTIDIEYDSNLADQINVPSDAYWGNLWNEGINWDFKIEPQPGLNGASMHWPRGKVLGGSSAINGLYLTRPGELEINTWKNMLGDMDGAENWTWESFLEAMKKSETFHPPSDDVAKTGGIVYDASSRGTSGPLQVSYPGWQDPINGMWVPSNKAIGNTGPDPYGGDNWGAWICTSTINPSNWTRSYSKSAYLDALPWRDNYDVMTDALVSRLIFDTSKSPMVATAVEYTLDDGKSYKTIKINKEVVLSGGSIGSPTILQHSGIGDKDILTKAGVKVISNLPGVGAHLQDHPSTQIVLKTTEATAGDNLVNGIDQTPQFLSFVNDAVAYPGSAILFGDGSAAQKSSIEKNLGKYAPTGDATVKAGYDAITKATLSLWDSKVGQVELLMGLTYVNGSLNLQVTLQHQYSHGSIYITSNDPTKYPAIDPNYLANPADIEIFTAGLKKVRELSQSGPLANILTEVSPGDKVQSDAEWADFLRKTLYTEFHPCSTCAMLPQDQGGVVDGNLLVYTTANVRVADASVPPIEFASHLMGSTYGLGEKAAEIILNKHDSSAAEQTEATARKQAGGSSGGDSNSGSTLAASLIPIISASFAVAACIVFG